MQSQKCSYHAQRAAFAVCMSCKKVLCQECATQWDGIWHCASCLAARRGTAVQRVPIGGWLTAIAATLLLLFLGARLMVWSGALIAGLR